MKRIIYILGLAALMASCVKEGPQGPTGPTGTAGIAGVAGKDGANGANGVDGAKGADGAAGTASCTQCHSKDAKLYTAQLQYNNSKHAAGATAGSENRSDCSGCHNNEGFNQRMVDGNFAKLPAAGYSDVTPISCYTCHNIHTKYDKTDYAFKTIAPVTCLADSASTINISSNPNSNLCASCHQSRAMVILDTTNKAITKLKLATATDIIKLTSGRVGPHHGPQGNLLNGINGSGAFEIAGNATYANSTHAVSANCISCHMGSSAVGVTAGGHSLNMTYMNGTTETLNSNACAACHGTEITAKTFSGTTNGRFEKSQASVAGLLVQLKTILGNKGWLDTNATNVSTYDLLINNKKALSSSNPLYLTASQLKVIYNYKFIEEDKSLGIHNPSYAKALLQNSIDSAKTW